MKMTRPLKHLLLAPALAAAGTGCTWDALYAQTSPPMDAHVAFRVPNGEAALRVLVDDFNQDGQLDVAALVGRQHGWGFDIYDVQQNGEATALMVMAGDGKGGLKDAVRQDVKLSAPMDLKAWRPTRAARPSLALYGMHTMEESAGLGLAGTPQLSVFALAEQALETRSVHTLDAVPYGGRVDVQTRAGSTAGSQQLVVAQPGAVTDYATGYPVSASVLESDDGTLANQGLVAQNPHGSYDVFTVVDLNEDGRMDTVLTDSCVYTVSLQFAQEDGSVVAGPPTTLAVSEIPIAVFVHRAPGESQPRVLLVSQSAVSLYRQRDNALELEEVTRVMGNATAAVRTDLDADGVEDLLVTSQEGRVAMLVLDDQGRVTARRIKDVRVVENEGEQAGPDLVRGTLDKLNPARNLEAITGSLAPAAGDLNGDGQPDLVLGTTDGRVLVHLAR